jgi:hypothetical protein
MSLTITNARVVEFYKNHPMINVDTINVLFVEILEKLFSEISPNMDNDFALRLINEMKNITTIIDKIQNDTIQNFTLKSMELKREYIHDLQLILNTNNTNAIKPMLMEYTEILQDKTKLAIDDKMNTLNNSIENMKSIHLLSTEKQIQIDKRVAEVLKKFDSSNKKGNMSEMILYNILRTIYPENQLKIVNTTKETGDILLTRDNKPLILLENKEYTQDVKQSEVDKFIRDINSQNCSGIFISQTSSIVYKKDFEIAIYGNNVGVYIGNANNDINSIKIAIDIIDTIKPFIKEKDTESEDIDDENTFFLSMEELEIINNEYSLFINQKNQHLKTIKEFTKKCTQEAENLQIPSIAIILSQHFGVNKRTEWACTLCDFIGKNKGSLSSHVKIHNKDEEITKDNVADEEGIILCQPVVNKKKTAKKNTKKQEILVIN